jgi:peptidoglycan-associated lipoprotein
LKLRNRVLVPVAALTALIAVSGCHKKQPAPTPETAPPASTAAPTAQLTATPTVISAGDQVQLSWRTTDASSVSIDGLGAVPTSGVKTVTPAQTTTYHLVATGAGGTADASALVTVNAPPAVSVPTNNMSAEEEFKANVQDIFFDYDTYDIRSDAQATLAKDASYLASNTNIKIVIGGYCDERGSDEYNLALGQRRAAAAKRYLTDHGVDASRVDVISYGKEKPVAQGHDDGAWAQNRNDQFEITAGGDNLRTAGQ